MAKKDKELICITKLIRGRRFMQEMVRGEMRKLNFKTFEGSYAEFLKEKRKYEQKLMQLEQDIIKFNALAKLNQLTEQEIKIREKQSRILKEIYVNF